MADVVEARRAAPWGESEVYLLIHVLDRRDYWLNYRHRHPMVHKRAVLRKVRRLLRTRLGVERSVEQIRRKIADLRYKSQDRIARIRRQIRNQRDAARQPPPASPPQEAPPPAAASNSPQQAPADPSPAHSPSAEAPSDAHGCQHMDEEIPPPPHTPTPAATPEASVTPEVFESPHVLHSPRHLLQRHLPSMTPDGVPAPSRSSEEVFNLLIRENRRLEREVRLQGQLLIMLRDQVRRETLHPEPSPTF